MGFAATCAIVVVFFLAAIRPNAADVIGKVQGANRPIVGSTVTLYAASSRALAQLAQAPTDDNGSFKLSVSKMPGNSVVYVIAPGGKQKATATPGAKKAIRRFALPGCTT